MAMGSSGGQGYGSLFTEINITPLTDIFLVLLIMMMVIAPGFTQNRQDIHIPKVESGGNLKQSKFTVEVIKEGQFFIDGKEVKEADLESAFQTALTSNNPDKHVVVRADESTPSEVVLKVFQAASAAGFKKLTIAGQPLAADRANELRESESPSTEGGAEVPQ